MKFYNQREKVLFSSVGLFPVPTPMFRMTLQSTSVDLWNGIFLTGWMPFSMPNQ